jgi:hypothetical protein
MRPANDSTIPAANTGATGTSAHPDAERQAARDISMLVARDDAGLSPRFVVVSFGQRYCVLNVFRELDTPSFAPVARLDSTL